MNDRHSGSCLCEQVKFDIEGNFDNFFFCHCKYCQKDSGSAHSANLFSSSAKIRWLAGESHVKTFNLPSTRHVKSFCNECGSAVPSIQMNGSLLVVPAGSLDSELSLKPTAHLFCSSEAQWSKDLEDMKRFDKFPS